MANGYQEQADKLRGLRGSIVVKWIGREVAVREVGVDGLPQWYDDAVPALQLDRLDLAFSSGSVASILTYQNYDHWGLYLASGLTPLEVQSYEPDSIIRDRALDELPHGEIATVDVLMDELGDIAEVRLVVAQHEVQLRPAEVYEDFDGPLRVVDMDENILVQVDGGMPAVLSERVERLT